MKSMQRLGGKMMKRSADQADVGTVIAQFKATEEMLDRLLKDLKTWKDGWDDVLKLQYNATEAFANLYKPIDSNDPDQRHTPQPTSPQTMQRCLALQKLYSDMKADLQQEILMIQNKVMMPLEDARMNAKKLRRTLKHRENTKLDYERYLSRVEHSRNKARTPKEEAALAKHEMDLQQAQIDYQTADEQVRTTFPPVCDAIMTLLPYLLANQVMIQTTMVGQIYTTLDQYCRSQRLPSPAPEDAEIVREWDQQFTGFRRELETELRTIANGKAVRLDMTLPEKSSSYTGLGIRSKATGLVKRPSNNNLPKPVSSYRADSASPGAQYEEEEEVAPPKPPRPGTMGAPSPGLTPSYPGVPMTSKLRMPSYSSSNAPYDQKSTSLMPGYPTPQPPPPYTESLNSSTPPSRYQTPVNGGLSPNPSVAGNDYFNNTMDARRASAASFASSAASVAAAKKKPPPPVPVKRLPSQQVQYVTALYDFEGQSSGDLAFREGDRIRVVKKTNNQDDWWDGELNGRTGPFPANYVQL